MYTSHCSLAGQAWSATVPLWGKNNMLFMMEDYMFWVLVLVVQICRDPDELGQSCQLAQE